VAQVAAASGRLHYVQDEECRRIVFRALASLFGRPVAVAKSRNRLALDRRPAVIYAIGDVHGCLAELVELERLIIDDAAGVDGPRLLVMLGDYIDRGPRSAQVLDHLIEPPPAGFTRVNLLGNHEQMLLDFLAAPRRADNWLEFGAEATLASYGADPLLAKKGAVPAATALAAMMPREHIEFLEALPTLFTVPGYAFAHAGIAPGVPLDQQSDEDLIWIRKPFLDAPPRNDVVVVHGHTPGKEPVVTAARICVDTAAFATGRLTAVRIPAEGEISFLSTEPAVRS
jgi:serine/threonine protein phosphatase 1